MRRVLARSIRAGGRSGIVCSVRMRARSPVALLWLTLLGQLGALSAFTALTALTALSTLIACRRGQRDDERKTPIEKLTEDRPPRRSDAPPVRRIFAGGEATCAFDAAGEVRCAGANEYGRLGDAVTVPRNLPTKIEHARGADMIALGRWTSCARYADGALECYGPLYARLRGASPFRMFPPRGSDFRAVLAVATGEDDACALLGDAGTTSGTVWCWGRNLFGEVGDGTLTARMLPTHVVGLREIDEIGVGHGHACARLHGGFVQCWGRNEHGQLGDGTTTDRASPVSARLAGATKLALGDSFTCAAMVDGTVRCFGDSEEGELGDGTTTSRSVPTLVKGLGGVIDVVAGEKHACVRRTDGGVWCWGGGAFGQLGDGGAANRSEAAPVGSPALIADELAAGLLHTCARRGDRVWCWGANTRGQLGDGTTIDRPRPVEVAW
jgi:hypothetical protein